MFCLVYYSKEYKHFVTTRFELNSLLSVKNEFFTYFIYKSNSLNLIILYI